jgi:hypothetical protein
MRKSYKILVGKPERNRPFGRPGHGPKWRNNIKVDFKEII